MPTIKKTVGQITLKVITDVKSTTYYYLLQSSMAPAPSTPTTNPPGSGWSTTEPEFFAYIPTQDASVFPGKDYYTRSGSAGDYTYTIVSNPTGNPSTNSYYEKIYGDTRSLYVTVQTLYTDNTFEYSTPSLSSSYEAAKEAYNRAKTALDLAGDSKQYFWEQPSSYSAAIPAGIYVTHIPQSQFKASGGPTQGNILIQDTGLTIRNGAISLASLTGNALNFYNPGNSNRLTLSINSNGLQLYGSSISTPDASLTANGLTLTRGGITVDTVGSNNGMYISSENLGSAIPSLVPTPSSGIPKTNWRAVIGSKFGVDSEGNLYANEAHISGEITASKLMISSNATISDTSGLISNSAVEVGGRNLFIGSIDTHLVNGSVTDTKTTTMLYFWTTPEESYTGYNSFGPTKTYSTTGHFTETFTAANDALNYFCIKHNGSTHDFAIYFEVPEDGVKAGETLMMSFDIVGFNPSVENGLDIKNFKLERGNKATDWTPAPEDIQNALGNKTENSDFDEYKKAVGEDIQDISESAFGDENSLAARLSSVSTEFGNLSTEYGELSNNINTYISFDGALVLGNSKNGNNVTITDTQVQFKDNNNVVGYIGGNGLHVDNYLSFGTFMFYQRANGHFTLKYLKKEDNE